MARQEDVRGQLLQILLDPHLFLTFFSLRSSHQGQGMFDILEADIVCLQETKIQRKDLRDDMVLVPGWDCYFSLPKYKKGVDVVILILKVGLI